jgi:hypothetical protein
VTTTERRHGPVTSELCVRLAGLLNDFNPAHYDLSFATEVGLPGVIAPGTLLQGWILADMAEETGNEPGAQLPAGVRSIDLRFRTPVLLNEHVLITYTRQADHVDVVATASSDPTEVGRIVASGTLELVGGGGDRG